MKCYKNIPIAWKCDLSERISHNKVLHEGTCISTFNQYLMITIKVYSSMNPQYLWIWSYLKIGLWKHSQVKMWSHWIRVGPKSINWILIKRPYKGAERRGSCSRDGKDKSRSSDHEKAREDITADPSEEVWLCQNLHFGPLASRTVGKKNTFLLL